MVLLKMFQSIDQNLWIIKSVLWFRTYLYCFVQKQLRTQLPLSVQKLNFFKKQKKGINFRTYIIVPPKLVKRKLRFT